MRKPQHLSPTSLNWFYKNQQEFYLMYLADQRPPRFPQTRPMSVGSAFDAYAKSYLHERIFGLGHDPKFAFDAIFEAQVEVQNRDWAREAGKHIFDEYKRNGVLADLLLDLQKAIGPPRFELEVKGAINGYREGVTMTRGDVPFLGKPDVAYINKFGANVILDWKVNGYCSPRNTSPMQGYVRLREDGSNKGQHKNAQLMSHKGIMINIAGFLETFDEEWATQLGIYGWLCGMDIGSDFIVAIDQVVCKPAQPRPMLRFAEHRLRVSADYQWRIFAKAQQAWEIIHSDHFFRDMSREESQERCKVLDNTAQALKGDGSEADQWFEKVTRGDTW
jgi:hypothetical protein